MYLGFSFWTTIILIVIVLAVIQGTCAYLILLERKIAAWTQDRIGPNRVGPWGLLQPIADGLKFLLKEEIIPEHVDKLFYLVAPSIALMTSLLAIAVVPFGPTSTPPLLQDHRTVDMVRASREPLSPDLREQLLDNNKMYQAASRGPIWPQTETELAYVLAADKAYAEAENVLPYKTKLAEYNNTLQFVITPHVNIGMVFVFAIGSLAIYAIVLGGWSSNSKYSFLGALRSSAQLISYEIPMGMSVLGVMLVTGSLNLERIIEHQYYGGWNFLFQPIACLLFMIAVFAECNRLPFDLPESEQELVGGYHTEYGGMKFALFFLGEYTHMITTSFLVVAVFFGGWLLPGVTAPGTDGTGDMIWKVIIYAAKMGLFIVFFMIVRWTIPRFRFDQLMGLAWKVLIPLAIINLVMVFVIQHFAPVGRHSNWLMLPLSLLILIGAGYVTLILPRGPTRVPLTVYGHGTDRPVVKEPQLTR